MLQGSVEPVGAYAHDCADMGPLLQVLSDTSAWPKAPMSLREVMVSLCACFR